MSTTPTAPKVSKTLLIVLGSVLAAAALFFLVVNPMLLSSDEAPEVAAVQPPSAATSAEPPADTATPEPVLQEPAPETFEIYSVRDPFQQLVQVAPPVATAPTAAATTTTTSTTPTEGATATSASNTSSADGADPGAADQATTVSLRDVLTEAEGEGEAEGGDQVILTAHVVVNGQGYAAREGDAFADSFQVLALSGKCGTFLFGEERFTLCQGEELRK